MWITGWEGVIEQCKNSTRECKLGSINKIRPGGGGKWDASGAASWGQHGWLLWLIWSTGGDWVMPSHIAVVFIFAVEIGGLLPVSVVQEITEGFEEDPAKVLQAPPLGYISQVEALVPSRILCLPSLNSMALISFPPCCVEEESREPSPCWSWEHPALLERGSPPSAPDPKPDGKDSAAHVHGDWGKQCASGHWFLRAWLYYSVF